MINLIEKKQIFLLKKAKSYLRNLKKMGIDVSKSSLCYLSTYSKTPGFAKIVLWLKERNYRKNFFLIILNHILSISSYSDYVLLNSKNQKFDTIIMTWGRKSDFKKNFFFDNFTNIKSDKLKNVIFFVIYLNDEVPKIIPKNVILLCKKKKKNLFFLLKTLLKNLRENFFSIRKLIHYFSAQTILAEIINLKIFSIIKDNKIKRIIVPYEGQPFQNYVFKNLKLKYKNIRTVGLIHSMIPALPLNFIRKDGSPDYIFLSGNSQKKLFIDYLGWQKKQIKVIESLRIKKKINKNSNNSFFFAMNVHSTNKITAAFKNYLLLQKRKTLPHIIVKKHPQMLYSKDQVTLEKKIKNLILKNKDKFNKSAKKKYSFHVGPTSAFIQFLENNMHVIHFTPIPEMDVYTKKMWRQIIPFEINKNTYTYKLTEKRQIIRLSNRNYNLKKSKIL